ncbi:T9SS type A sorting domain-containing protein [Chryseolinea sp. H1M3-3]|uniref:Ig-like domain-containing protein n=1 Tax=Chryseolinea sp. H1M3-3 TaxID=3034144 RepID=UPI0023EB4780|nr:T9SS type A sorting domain-containing protein [Chryseolinea sp. H1M3-3]
METPVSSRSPFSISKKLWLITLLQSGICILFITLNTLNAFGQGRLVLNGATIKLNGSVSLVIDNSSSNAITRNSGHIISEGQSNTIKWNIGTTVGTYVIPWGYGSSEYIPLTFTKTAGSGAGYFLFSTFHTTSNNLSQLPSGIANLNGANGSDNSLFVSDRFWQVNAMAYSVKPEISNMEFTYLDSENSAPNTITETLLRAKRYNSTLTSWGDFLPTSTINTTTNKLTITSVNASDLHGWWMLANLSTNRYWVASSNSNANLSSNWAESAGGAGNAGAPTSAEAVIFDGTSDFNCTLNSDLTAATLTVSPGFVGIISQGSNLISVGGNAVFSGGTFTGGDSNISVGGNFTVSGAAFTAPTTTLDIKGNFAVTSGTFLHNNGNVSFSGTSGLTQTISSTAATTFNNISVTNNSVSPGVSVQSNQNLKGVLTLGNNVNFDADGSANAAIFKLLSTSDSPTNDAAIGILPAGAQVSGKVTVQRFMTKEGSNNTKIYRYISSPIFNATVADLQQEIPVTGSFTGRSTCSGCVSSSQSLFAYAESVITDTDRNGEINQNDGYVDFPANINTETFVPGQGYALYVRGNILSSTSWDLRGTINSGNVTPVSLPVTYTSSGTLINDGWNLVGNPFPSTIDWNSSNGWTKANLETSIYITDNATIAGVRFATWNGVVGTNGGSQYISTGQGFWVKANGAGTPILQADENIKTAGTQTTFFRQATPVNVLRVAVLKGSLRDETIIHFREDATVNFDDHADSRKLSNSVLNISSILDDGKNVAINSLPPIDCGATIPLTIDNISMEKYTMEFSEFESFPTNITITLIDNFLNTTHDIRNGNYTFSVISSAASYGPSRFKISFNSLPLNTEIHTSAPDVCVGAEGIITIENAQPGATYTAIIGDQNFTAVDHVGTAKIIIPEKMLSAGDNHILIKSSVMNCSDVVEKELSLNVKSMVSANVEPAANCGFGSLLLKATGAPENGSYNWYDEPDAYNAIEHTNTLQTPLLKKSKTYYVAVVNALGCEGDRIPVKATIINLDPVTITTTSHTLTSSYTTGNQWFLNGMLIEGATQQSIQPKESGTYKTEIIEDGCITWAEVGFTVIPQIQNPVPSEEGNENEENTPDKEILPQMPEQEVPRFPAIIQISPNPVTETALLEISNTFQNVTNVTIINGLGQPMGNIDLQQMREKKIGILKLGDYPSGIYIVRISCGSKVYEQKIIKK